MRAFLVNFSISVGDSTKNDFEGAILHKKFSTENYKFLKINIFSNETDRFQHNS